MDHFIGLIGKIPYAYSMSKSQRTLHAQGDRQYHTAKDLQMESQNQTIDDSHVITMTDVDYYVDMNKFLKGNPLLMYTFVPNEPAGSTTEGVYSVLPDDTVDVVMNGGARYRHSLWDYDDDHIVIDHWFYSIIYLIEQVKVTEDRRIIFFNPIRKTYGPLGWLITGRRLTRRKLNHSGFGFTRFTKTEADRTTCYYSICRLGEYTSCTVPSGTFATAFIRTAETKDPNIGQIERVFNHAKIPDSLNSAALFYDAYKRCPEMFGQLPNIVTPCVDQHSYQTLFPLVTDDGKTSMRAIWPGYLKGGAFSPVKSLNNDHACLAGRMEEPKNKEKQVPPIYYSYLAEFVKYLVPDAMAGTLAPFNHDEMAEKFNRPSQRALLEQVKNFLNITDPTIRSFQKAEAYPKIAAPRNISTLPMDHNFVFGQFTLPFKYNVLKQTHWYAFARTPQEFSTLLHLKASHTEYAVPTDADKLDGSVSALLRDVYLTCLTRAYAPLYRAEIRRLENKERYASATTSHGVKYITGNSILSGSVDTSDMGSIINGFVSYCALRNHYDSELAWQKMGIYGGDDGVTYDLPPNTMMRTAAVFGLSFKAEMIPQGCPVPFLGRVFIDPWTTDASICDVQRQFRKLHLTASPKIVPDALVLHRKATGLILTDPKTPVIGDWARKVLELTEDMVKNITRHRQYISTLSDRSYWARYDANVQFLPPDDEDYTRHVVSINMDASIAQLDALEAKIKSAKTLSDLYFDSAIATDVKNTVDAIVDREIIIAAPRKTIPDMVEEKAQLEIKVCRSFSKGKVCKHGDACRFSHVLPPKDSTLTVADPPAENTVKRITNEEKKDPKPPVQTKQDESTGRKQPDIPTRPRSSTTHPTTSKNAGEGDRTVRPPGPGAKSPGPNGGGKDKVSVAVVPRIARKFPATANSGTLPAKSVPPIVMAQAPPAKVNTNPFL
jgi:hypothetical protein